MSTVETLLAVLCVTLMVLHWFSYRARQELAGKVANLYGELHLMVNEGQLRSFRNEVLYTSGLMAAKDRVDAISEYLCVEFRTEPARPMKVLARHKDETE